MRRTVPAMAPERKRGAANSLRPHRGSCAATKLKSVHADLPEGHDHAAFVSFFRGYDSTESFHFLLACNPLWYLEYQQQSWFAHDAWLQYAESHSAPICASKIEPKTRSSGRAV